MVSVSGTTIKMTRGDTLRARVSLEDREGNPYTPHEGDRIRFAMKYTYDQDTPVILKEIPIDSMVLVLDPADTKSLPMPSSYVYDMEITYANGDVYTFIDKAKFVISEEVY